MRCAHIKGMLSSYLDGMLNAEQESLVKNHLAKCENCRKELQALQSLVNNLRSLEPLKAPDDFLASLHTRLAEKESWPARLKSFLLIPARIRLSWEFATIASSLVLVFFIYHLVFWIPTDKSYQEKDYSRAVSAPAAAARLSGQKNHPEKSSTVTAPSAAVSGNAKKDAMEQTRGELKKELDLKDITVLSKQEDLRRSRQVPATPQAVLKPGSGTQVTKSEMERGPAAPAAPGPAMQDAVKSTQPMEELTLAEKKAVPRPDQAPVTVGGVNNPEQLQMVLLVRSDRVQLSFSSNKAQEKGRKGKTPAKAKESIASGVSENMAVALETTSRDMVSSEISLQIKEMVVPLGGKIIHTELNAKTQQPEYLTIELPSQNYQPFLEKLNNLGTLQAPAAESVPRSQKAIQNRLQIITE